MVLFQKNMKKMNLRFDVKLMFSVNDSLGKLGGERQFMGLMTTPSLRHILKLISVRSISAIVGKNRLERIITLYTLFCVRAYLVLLRRAGRRGSICIALAALLLYNNIH
jgi:hypothetical protein